MQQIRCSFQNSLCARARPPQPPGPDSRKYSGTSRDRDRQPGPLDAANRPLPQSARGAAADHGRSRRVILLVALRLGSHRASRSNPHMTPRPPFRGRKNRGSQPAVALTRTSRDGRRRGQHRGQANWIQTVPDKGWCSVLRPYVPLNPWFDKTWQPGEIEMVLDNTARVTTRPGIARDLGITDLHPHRLRHTLGTLVQEQLGDARLTAETLGHAGLGSVAGYTKITAAPAGGQGQH